MNALLSQTQEKEEIFDIRIKTPFIYLSEETLTIPDIIFSVLPHRPESSIILQSHINDNYIQITLPELRLIIYHLSLKISAKGMKKDDTVMLISMQGCNELFTALYFVTFISMGIRVFMPMFPELKELKDWVELTNSSAIIAPLAELNTLKDYEKEKDSLNKIKSFSATANIPFFDNNENFDLLTIIEKIKNADEKPKYAARNWRVEPCSEAMILSTSGTSGKSKLVVYQHKAFVLNCMSWQQHGLFNSENFGNTGFTPLFTHTIGIRSFINALWTGHPVCLLTTDWFYKKPEQVCYLLLKMKPAHIVGGPAMFNALMELYRNFPELKQSLSGSLKAFISIGAPFAKETARQLRSATGISLYNAYGTTETLMASINMEGGTGLGKPLPGVTFGLKKITNEENLYQLHVQSRFQCSRILGERQKNESHFSGDLVSLQYEDEIVFVRRENSDFIKDDFGVKIPVDFFKQYYKSLYMLADHIELFSLHNKPGLAALLFINDPSGNKSLNSITGLIKNINYLLQRELEPFEYEHRHLAKITIVNDRIPLTAKGTISRTVINDHYRSLINDLVNPICHNGKIKITDKESEGSSFQKYVNPDLGEMLKALKMDIAYSSAEGDLLFYSKNNKEVEVLDLVGGYGANLLGHSNPEIRNTLVEYITQNKPALNSQGSLQNAAGKLAEKLNSLLATKTKKNFRVQFGNSGTEAVEIALHHASLEWRKKIEKAMHEQLQLFGTIDGINVSELWKKNMASVEQASTHVITLKNCFHGYSGSARGLLNAKKRRSLFSSLLKVTPLILDEQDPNFERVLSGHLENNFITINKIVRENGIYKLIPFKISTIIASIIEPVIGEGGIKEIDTSVADRLSTLDIPLISDEIQCGLGRSGTIPAYNNASYYLFGKALGGGFEKISAVLIDNSRFHSSFPKYYSSTFGNGELACTIAAKTIDIITRDKVALRSLKKGEVLKSALEKIALAYPEVISEVSGKGLMIGIYLNEAIGEDNVMLRTLFQQDLAGYLVAAWLLNNHQVRIFPSLAAANCLRVEPSCLITTKQISKFCMALEDLCKACKEKNIYKLFGFLMNDDVYDDRSEIKRVEGFPTYLEEPLPGAKKVGFISHFTFPLRELKLLEPSFSNASETGLRILFNKMQILLEGKPFKILSKNFMNGKVHFTFYLVPLESAQLENAHKWGKKRMLISKMQDTVDKMARENITHISLGGYSSILTNNGVMLAQPSGTKIITGNTLTAAACLHHLDKYLQGRGSEPTKIAIVGASGNIGTGLAECIAENIPAGFSLLLVGKNIRRLHQIENKLSAICIKGQVEVSCNLFSLEEADVIICCTNSSDPILFPHHLTKNRPVFIIDMSVPAAISDGIRKLQNVKLCNTAANIYLPHDKELVISSHSPKGSIFCCAAEVLLESLYETGFSLKGRLERKAIMSILEIARKEKFLT